jgi:CIC family chloride channel protein
VSDDASLGARATRLVAGAFRGVERLRQQGPHIAEDQLFLLLAVIIGIVAGLLVVCFRVAIETSRVAFLGSGLAPTLPRVVLAPVLTGLAAAALVKWVFPLSRGSGINQTKAALYIYDGRIPSQTVVGKFLSCVLSIGGGHSLGPEDPSLQIGAGLASAAGRALGLSRDRLRLVAPVGAAAGIAAAFNTPITGVLFVIEEVIGRWSAGILGSVILSAVSAVIVERWFLGAEPLFRVPEYELSHPAELLAYAALGVIGGVASLLFVRWITWLKGRARRLPRWSQVFQPALAGLLIGLVAMRFPQIMGAGYDHVDLALHEQYGLGLLLGLAALKILATGLSHASGTPGGLFAPTLFIGAMIGTGVGDAAHALLPELPVAEGAYGLVGMGALFAAILRAPMTSVFMMLEVSGNYSIILPVMITNTIAYLISRSFQPTPILDVLARDEGLHLPSLEEERERDVLCVEDAMRPPRGSLFGAEMSVEAALTELSVSSQTFALVGRGSEWGGLGREHLHALVEAGRGAATLADVLPETELPLLHGDQPLDEALRRIHGWPLLPVVHRADLGRLVGVVSLADIVEAYRREGERSGGATAGAAATSAAPEAPPAGDAAPPRAESSPPGP